MGRRNYFYLSEKNITIEASTALLNRIQENIEEGPDSSPNPDCIIRVNEADVPVKIVRDKAFPFASTRENTKKSYQGVDLYRYGTHVRTIWKKSNQEYEVQANTFLDEKAALRCFKNFYFENSNKNKLLLQSSLVELGKEGILIVGKYRSGKTTLCQVLLEEGKANLISGGNTLLSFNNDKLVGEYFPRPIYIRFSGIVQSPSLIHLLSDISSCNATQYFDEDAISKIVATKSFDVDAGLAVSRKRYSNLLSIKSKPSAIIKKIIFTNYHSHLPIVRNILLGEAKELIDQRIFPKNTNLHKLEETPEITPPENIYINTDWFTDIKLKEIYFSRTSDLTREVLEDILT